MPYSLFVTLLAEIVLFEESSSRMPLSKSLIYMFLTVTLLRPDRYIPVPLPVP